MIALLLSTLLAIAIPCAFVALWLAAAKRIRPARRPDLDPPRGRWVLLTHDGQHKKECP